MTNQWYIFRKGQHFGPFSFEQMEEKLRKSEISAETMIWQQGDKDGWKQLKRYENFQQAQPLATKKNVVPNDQKIQTEEPQILKFPTASPIQEVPSSTKQVSQFDSQLQAEVENFKKVLAELPPEVTPPQFDLPEIPAPKKRSKFALFVFLLFMLSLSFGSVLLIKMIPKPLQVTIAYDYVNKKFVGSINRIGPGKMSVQIASVRGISFSEDIIIVASKTEYSQESFVFENFTFEKGTDLADGLYDVTISGEDFGTYSSIIKFLKQIPFLRDYLRTNLLSSDFRFKKRVLVFDGDQEEFEQQLQKFQSEILSKYSAPVAELIQRYQTCIGLLNSMESELASLLKLASIPAGQFEKKYANQFAPIFEGVMIESHKIHVSNYSTNPIRSSENANFVEFGKDVGDLLARTAEQIRKSKGRLPKQTKEKLLLNFSLEKERLIEIAQTRSSALQEKIDLYKQQLLSQ